MVKQQQQKLKKKNKWFLKNIMIICALKNKYNLKKINKLCYLYIINTIVNYYSVFIWLYYLDFSIINSFNFFKKIFINNNYLNLFSLKNNKKLYLYYYIMFKKQNSLMKKNFHYLHNLHPIFYKKNLKKKISLTSIKNKNFKLIKNFYILKLILKKNNNSKNINILKIRKKFQKVILKNRRLYKFLKFNSFKSSQSLSKDITINSKVKTLNNLLNLEYSLFNVILNTNIIKSYEDLKLLSRSNSIFLNRNLIKNLNKVLEVGDLIEFNLSYRFYSYMLYFKNVFIKHITKIRNKIWYKLKFKDKNKLDYTKNSLLNNVFKNNLIFRNNIPGYLEVDYYTLSIVILMKNFNFNSLNINIKKILVIYLFKLYNWK